MSEKRRLSDRNARIAEMLSDGGQLKNFYRFIAQNPYINLHDACQIIIERPDASVCNSIDEWNAMGRRVNKGSKGIAYYDHDGYKQFVFDGSDTHGEEPFQREIVPLKVILIGLGELNGRSVYEESWRSDYRKIHNGIYTYLEKQGELMGEEVRDGFFAEGIAYTLYSRTGFPKTQNIQLHGLPYSYRENAELVKEIYIRSALLVQEICDAYASKQSEVKVIDDRDEEPVSDEPIISSELVEEPEEPEARAQKEQSEAREQSEPISPVYRRYMEAQQENPKAIVLLRVGDFWEVMGEKARTVAEELGLMLTGREVGLPERVPMCGFPYHVKESYIEKLLKKHGVILAEEGQESKYILSQAEVMGRKDQSEGERVSEFEQREEPHDAAERTELTEHFGEESQTTPRAKNPVLVEIDDEPNPFDVEQPGEEDDTEVARDEDEAREDDFGKATEWEAERERVENKRAEPARKKSEKGIKERKRKEKPQMSLFDILEPQEQTEHERLIERNLKYGSGVEHGKYRIFDKYHENPTLKVFADYVKSEYGIGGRGGLSGDNEEHDAKGIRIWYRGETGESLDEVFLKWSEAAVRIADLIDEDNYFTEREWEMYPAYRKEQNRLREQRAEEANQKKELAYTVMINAPSARKQRILTEYSKMTDNEEFAEILKKEYGNSVEAASWYHARYDANGVWLKKYNALGNTELTYNLSWNEFAEKFGDIIKAGRLIPKESEGRENEYIRELEESDKVGEVQRPYNRFTELSSEDKAYYAEYIGKPYGEPRETPWDAVQECTVIARGIYSVSTAGHGGIMIDRALAPHILSPEALEEGVVENGCYCYEEDAAESIPLRELYDKGILDESNIYFTERSVRSDRADGSNGYIPFKELTETEKAVYLKDWNGWINESLAHWYPDYWTVYEQSCRTETEWQVRRFVDLMVEEGTRETHNGDFYFAYNHYTEEAEQFAREHRREIAEELALHKEVREAELFNDGIDVKFRREYCSCLDDISLSESKNKEGEQGENTNLNAVLDQSELGGAKSRFKGNTDAIRLMNKLYFENREATDEERKVLAKYVGWGGLSQAFEEKNEGWRKEYAELKTLLSPEDYDQARSSTLNAYYTPREVIGGIYAALERFGVKGNNRILEPAMGTGNFFGYMPKEISDGAKLYGVELNEVTGKIAAKLYPQANVQIKGFEDTSFPNDKFDIVVGNVPFGGYGVADSEYNRYNFKVHDYFLAKSVDKVRPGGIVAVITSKGTLDKLNPSARKYVAERAELLGAIRLPNTAFKQTSGTEAVADILFFRKREEKTTDITHEEWLGTCKTAEGYEINNYFISHPEMLLGILAEEHGLYGGIDTTVKPDGREIKDALAEAIKNLPQDVYNNPETLPEQEREAEVDYNIKPFCYKAERGKVYQRVGDELVEQTIPKTPKDAYQRISGMIALREGLHHILDIQISGCSDEVLKSEQSKLNARYDLFVRRYGNLNNVTNSKLFKEDGDSALLFACENVNEETKAVTKADIFFKRTIRPYVVATNTDDPFEALQISKNERGKVDIAYIEELTGKDYETVVSELGPTVFRDPEQVKEGDKYSGFVTSEEYLSGQVVSKLEQARAIASEQPEYRKNVEALERVQPEKLTASEISVRLGATWVDKSYYKRFYCELVGVYRYQYSDVELFYNPHDSSWRLDQKDSVRGSTKMNQTEVYGTKRAPAYRLFIDALNLKPTTIYDTIEENGTEKRVVNQAETIAAREKQNKIKEAFADWIFKTPERREELEAIYNRLFNRTRLPSYDGSYLKFPEMNPAVELKGHQKNAVHRIITSKSSTLLHHVVGAGKTFTVIASIMKMRQLGLCKKAMVTVPNHLVQQWSGEWRKLYPNAHILVATKEDLEKDNRKRFVSKVALGDWDGIIIAQSSFAKIPISEERQIGKLKEEIMAVELTIEKEWIESGMPRGAVKNLEKIKKNKQTQLKKLMDTSGKDDVLKFEDLGVDYLFVDEAQGFKNLFLFSKMNNVAGISNAASQRASDLKLKCEYLQERHGSDRGVVFATGTPVSNSMTEMYTMQTYLQPSELRELGITFFDGWAADFGETITSMELTPSGQGYRARTRFAKFTNLPELLKLYRSFADVQTSEMVKLNVPEAERNIVNLKPSDTVIELAEEIAKRADRIYGGGVDSHIDNMLKVVLDGKKLALDPRCLDSGLNDEPDSKLNECVRNIYEVWEESAEKRGTQIVFCDLSTPKIRYEEYRYGKDFDAYNELKYKLVQRGIPEQEIAYIHEANTDEQKQALFDKVNAGAVRVLIGSTEKCGAGTNVQKRLIALHHLDTPYRPSDMEQREGRIIRQGNTNEKVKIFTYVTERTFDSYSYQILENKQRFISQINRGDLTIREAEDIDETTLSYAEIKAITAANPKIKRKMEVDAEVARLRVLEGQYRKNLYELQDKIYKTYPEEIRKQELLIERIGKDLEMLKIRRPAAPEAFEISVNGTIYTDRKEGGKALTDALYASKVGTPVAEYCGFKISMNPIGIIANERDITLSCEGQYTVSIGESASGNLTRLENFLNDLPEREERLKNKLKQLKNDVAIAKEQSEKPFDKTEDLKELLAEQTQLNAELDLNKRESAIVDDEGESEEVNYRGLPDIQRQTMEMNIIDEEDKVAEMQVEVLPDYTVTQETMHAYGYTWDGMLPVSRRAAYRFWTMGLGVNKLAPNDTDTPVEKYGDLNPNERVLYGIEKPVWNNYLKQDKSSRYLWARKVFCDAASKVVNEDMSYVDENFTINFTETNSEERTALEQYLANKEMPNPNELSWYVPELSEEFSARLWSDVLHEYGWEESDMPKAIADKLSEPAMRETAQRYAKFDVEYELAQILEGMTDENRKALDLPALDDELIVLAKEPDIVLDDKRRLPGLLLLKNETLAGRWYVLNDTSARNNDGYPLVEGETTDVKTVLAYNGLAAGNPLRTFYTEEDAREYLARKATALRSMQESGRGMKAEPPQKIDYEKEVIKSVNTEFEIYKSDMLSKNAEEIFEDSYKINTMSELKDILESGTWNGYLQLKYYRALYEDRGSILTMLFDDYIKNEYASLDSSEEAADFVRDYCEHHHKAVLYADAAPYLKTSGYAREHGELEQYRRSHELNEVCREEMDKAISKNFDGMHLKEGFERELMEKYGRERVEYILATTVKENVWDGRYSPENREWAEHICVSESEKERIACCLHSHPAVLDGLIRRVRRNEYYDQFLDEILQDNIKGQKKEEEEELSESKYLKETSRGYKVMSIAQDKNGRNVAVVQRKSDYTVAIGYDISDGTWAQGVYDFKDEKSANEYREKYYGRDVEPPEKWYEVFVSQDALIKTYQKSSLMRMPSSNPEYADYTYFIYNNHIRESRQLVDKQSDSRELCYKILLSEGEVVNLRNRAGDEAELTAQEFSELVNHTSDKDYVRDEKPCVSVNIPREAMLKEYEKASLFRAPNGTQYEGYSYYLPNSVLHESAEGNNAAEARLAEVFTVKMRKGTEEVEITTREFFELVGKTTAEDYKHEPTAMDDYREQQADKEEWKEIPVSEQAVIANYERSTLFKMPKGKYEGYVYYIPSGMVRKSEVGLKLRLPETFKVHLKISGEGATLDLTTKQFAGELDGKTDEDYESIYRKPSEEARKQFEKVEKQLRESVPEEMRNKPNWVAVRTRENKETGRPEKFLIDVHTNKFAESDNPKTWTDFDTACEYAKDHGGVALAYALDGKDGIACIDLDHCIGEDGKRSALADEVLSKCGKTYIERSVSGTGLHIFGKTKGENLRSFSKDGDMEYYQDSHFITMTGDGAGFSRLESFDTPAMKAILERKLERRQEWKNPGKGMSGLSQMNDRELLEKAFSAKNGDTVKRLYNGEDLRHNHSNSDMSLMNYLAFYSGGDIDRMTRIFATSGLYRSDKPQSYYEHTAIKAAKDTPHYTPPKASNSAPKADNDKGGK